jgi:hypothetical protein
MAPPPHADDVSATSTHDDCLSLTDCKQKSITKDQLHHETLEALQLRLPNTSADPSSLDVLELLRMRWPEASLDSQGLSDRNFDVLCPSFVRIQHQ